MTFLLLFISIPININALISPTIINATGEYYITSESGSFASDIITCQSPSCIIICDNPDNCSTTTINATLSNTVDILCSEDRSCYETEIISGPSTSLTINCANDSSCRRAVIYCPVNTPCNINCDYGTTSECLGLDIHIENNNYQQLELNCGTISTHCLNVDLHCSDSGLMTNYGWIAPNQYVCFELDKCCPINLQSTVNHITCAENTECFVNCTDANTDCSYKTIVNGSNALSLSITCPNEFGCHYVDFQCPTGGDCVLTCEGKNSCRNFVFVVGTIKSLTIYCLGQYSCQYGAIIGSVVNTNVNIHCSDAWSCYNMDIDIEVKKDFNLICTEIRACRSFVINILGNRVKTDVTITTTGEWALYKGVLELNNAKSLTINCIRDVGADKPCSEWTIITTDIDDITILCENQQACSSSEFLLSADNIIFQCHGDLSCEQSLISLNITNSVSITTTNPNTLTETDTSIFCLDCMNTYNCLENITIFCGINTTPFPIIQGDQCRNCMCNQSKANQIHTIPFINNVWEQCIPTQQPTVNPTYNPTFFPTFIPTIYPSSIPTFLPTIHPTFIPTINPTNYPSTDPTYYPTNDPTIDPTNDPTNIPTVNPTPHEGGVIEPDIATTDMQQTEADNKKLNDDETTHGNSQTIIIIVIVAILLLTIVIGLVIYMKKRKQKQKAIINNECMVETDNVTEMSNYNDSNGNGNTELNDLTDQEILDDVNHITKGGDVTNDDNDEKIMHGINVNTEFVIQGEDEITAGNMVNDDSSESPTGETDVDDEQVIDDEFMMDANNVTVQ